VAGMSLRGIKRWVQEEVKLLLFQRTPGNISNFPLVPPKMTLIVKTSAISGSTKENVYFDDSLWVK
jgi:hypothetical protein